MIKSRGKNVAILIICSPPQNGGEKLAARHVKREQKSTCVLVAQMKPSTGKL